MWDSRNLSRCSSVVVSPIATTPTFSEGGVKRKVVENGGGVGAASAKEETSLQGSLLSRLACCSVERRGSPFVFGMKKMIDLTYLASSIGEAFFFFGRFFSVTQVEGKTHFTHQKQHHRGRGGAQTTQSPPPLLTGDGNSGRVLGVLGNVDWSLPASSGETAGSHHGSYNVLSHVRASGKRCRRLAQ